MIKTLLIFYMGLYFPCHLVGQKLAMTGNNAQHDRDKELLLLSNSGLHNNNVPISAPIALTGVREDFQVNENRGPCSRVAPAIAIDDEGNFIITWADQRNSEFIYFDIYCQRYNNDGDPLAGNIKVNDELRKSCQFEPDIAMTGSGNFVIVWLDERNGKPDIYCQQYADDGTTRGCNFMVNDNSIAGYHGDPAVAMADDGNFVVVWEYKSNRYSSTEQFICCRRYNSNGTASSPQLLVNFNGTGSWQQNPAAAMNGAGDFVIIWQGERNGKLDIWGQCYHSNGIPSSTIFKVNDIYGRIGDSIPAVALANTGNFVVAWQDYRHNNWDLYCQRFDNKGMRLGRNFRVNDDLGFSDQLNPVVTIDDMGNFTIAWIDQRHGAELKKSGLYCQRYDSKGTAIDANVRMTDNACIIQNDVPALGTDNSGDIIVVWTDRRDAISELDSDIYYQRYNNDCIPVGANTRVNENVGSSYQNHPAIGVDNNGNFAVAWHDFRNDTDPDIFCQLYNYQGIAVGANFRINDDTGSHYQLYPALCFDSNGKFMVAWQDDRDGHDEIWGQRYNNDGKPIGKNFQVSEDTVGMGPHAPDIGVDSSGGPVIVWRQDLESNYNILCQRYHGAGNAIGNNFRVNENPGEIFRDDPAIGVHSSGYFMIVWENWRNNNNDIYGQLYNDNGNPIGINFRVNDDDPGSNQFNPAIGATGNGNFIVAWQDERDSTSNIYCQRYRLDGNPIGKNFKVTDINGNQYGPAVAGHNNGNFAIAWEYFQEDHNDIYCQHYSNNGTRSGPTYRVNNDIGNSQQINPNLALAGTFIYYTWEDNRKIGAGSDFEIFARMDWFNPSSSGLIPPALKPDKDQD